MKKGPPTPKGFRDIDPKNAAKRRKVINSIVEVLEENDFVPLETPTIEFAETLTGKYGEEERLIYKFADRGGRELALRYDLTVPLARHVANNPSLKFPFRRYQIGQVFRGENPQAGRYREFTQFDFDTVGSENLEDDAKIIACALSAVKKLGLTEPVMAINDRKNFEGVPKDVVIALDKIHKIKREGVVKELAEKGYKTDEIEKYLDGLLNADSTESLNTIYKILNTKYKLKLDVDFYFDSTLARGLDYYTGSIFELKPTNDPASLSIGSGGRYDNLIGMFTGKPSPAVGFSFGIDRLVEAIGE